MDFANTIKKIQSYTSQHINNVNELIANCCKNESSLINEVGNFIILAGGKRIRPMLIFLSYKLLVESQSNQHNLNSHDLVRASAVVELIHTASLLHDDIIDESTKRRGKKTANTIWGNKEVILVGDFLFSKSFEILSQISNQRITKLVANACLQLTRGEVSQLGARQVNITTNQYYDIIYKKTASLFEASSQIGSLLALQQDSDINIINSVANIGKNLGFCFQIMDDLLDYKSNSLIFGKDCGRDFLEGKTTMPVILSQESGLDFIMQTFANKQFTEQNFTNCLKIMDENNIFTKTKQIANIFASECLKELSNFKDSASKQHLTDLIKSLCNRQF